MSDSQQRKDETKVISRAAKVTRLRELLRDNEIKLLHDFPVLIPKHK